MTPCKHEYTLWTKNNLQPAIVCTVCDTEFTLEEYTSAIFKKLDSKKADLHEGYVCFSIDDFQRIKSRFL